MDFTSLFLVCMLSPVLAIPPEPQVCPSDSISVDGVCECDKTLCPPPPPCEKSLNLVKNSTGEPGNCCPEYSCDHCPLDVILAGNCTCAPEAIVTPSGDCECVDPNKSLVEDECVCDKEKTQCPPIAKCDGDSVAVKELRGCCAAVSCKTCPSDSHPYYYNDEQVEDKCVCFPCRNPVCPKNQVPVSVRKGRNFPGHCCDIYKCVNKTCNVNGTVYTDGEEWRTVEDHECKCHNGIALCKSDLKPPSCTYEGNIYPHESSWIVDSCTNCTCLAGVPKCIAHLCDMVVEEVAPDCPPLTTCKKTCDYGYKVNKYGCEICRCKAPGPYDFRCKFWELERMLESNNLREEDVIRIVGAYLHGKATTPSSTSTTEPSPVCNSSTNIVYYVLAILVVIILGGLIIKVTHHSSYSLEKKPKEASDFGKQYKYELQPIAQLSAFDKKPNDFVEKYNYEPQSFNDFKDKN